MKETRARVPPARLCNPFDGQANIVKGTVLVASRILDRASNESYLGRKPDRFHHDFRRVAKPVRTKKPKYETRAKAGESARLLRGLVKVPGGT